MDAPKHWGCRARERAALRIVFTTSGLHCTESFIEVVSFDPDNYFKLKTIAIHISHMRKEDADLRDK